MQNHGALQLIGNRERTIMLALDHLDARIPLAVLDGLGHVETNIAAACNNDAAGFRFLVPEQGKRAANLLARCHDIGQIARVQLVG